MGTTQPTLFDEPDDDEYPARDFAAAGGPPAPAPAPVGAQAENLDRVRSKIGAVVLAFLRSRLADGAPEFVIAELHAYVARVHGIAPASPDRILRDLRQRELCCYEVVNRRQSRYRVTRVAAAEGEAA